MLYLLASSFFKTALVLLPQKKETAVTDSVAVNIKNYSNIWDEIANKGKLEMFNDSNFTKDVIIHSKPNNIVDIYSARAFWPGEQISKALEF